MSEILKKDGKIIVKPGQDIVASMVEAFKTELKEALSQGDGQLAIDLEGVDMMDSMGLGVLIAAHNSLQKKGAKLELMHVNPDIANLLKNMRLDQHFSLQ